MKQPDPIPADVPLTPDQIALWNARKAAAAAAMHGIPLHALITEIRRGYDTGTLLR